jgi:hypothetical protein
MWKNARHSGLDIEALEEKGVRFEIVIEARTGAERETDP